LVMRSPKHIMLDFGTSLTEEGLDDMKI